MKIGGGREVKINGLTTVIDLNAETFLKMSNYPEEFIPLSLKLALTWNMDRMTSKILSRSNIINNLAPP